MKRSILAAAIVAALRPMTALAAPASTTALPDVASPIESGRTRNGARFRHLGAYRRGSLANIIDDGATRRVLPVVGKGSLPKPWRSQVLRGVDLAILQTDVLDYAGKRTTFRYRDLDQLYCQAL